MPRQGYGELLRWEAAREGWSKSLAGIMFSLEVWPAGLGVECGVADGVSFRDHLWPASRVTTLLLLALSVLVLGG